MNLILIILVCNQVRSIRALDGMMRVLATIGWVMAVAGIYTLLFVGIQPGDRLRVFEVNENLFGTMLILMIPGVIWSVLRAPERRRRLYMQISVVYILCTIVLVALSGSRGSALSLVLVLLAFGFWKPVRPWGMVGVSLAAGMLVAAPFVLGTLMSRIEKDDGGALGGRLVLWQASMLLLEDHPWSGAGIGNGPQKLHWYVLSLKSSGDPERILPSHNPILEAGVETGFVGIVIYVSILASGLWRFFRFRSRWHMQRGVLAAYFPLVLGTAAGYFATWVKGGGLEVHSSYFVLLTLLLIPSHLMWDAGSGDERPGSGDGSRARPG
jgi:O-antigen ligase